MEEQAKQAEEAAKQEQEDKARVNMLLEAKAFGDTALGEERLAKIKYDAALSEERLAAAQEERARSVLDIVRAGKEFDEMDINNAAKVLEMIKGIQEEQRLDAAKTVVPQPAVKK